MPEAWRIVKAQHSRTAFTGEGAARTSGRWNSRGARVVYTSETRALAMLETVVHLVPPVYFEFRIFRVGFHAKLVQELDRGSLPKDWRALPAPISTRLLGDEWLRHAKTAILRVPSIIVPEECNFLLNPAHPDFKQIEIGPASEFAFDGRLPS